MQQADDLNYVAQSWANYLRETNSFYHQGIGALIAWSSYTSLGETPAKVPFDLTGAPVEAIRMKGAEHRAIVLDGHYGYVGIGIVSDAAQTTTWIVADFGGR